MRLRLCDYVGKPGFINEMFFFLYSVRVIPNFLLKIRQKQGVSVRPTDAPVSDIDYGMLHDF